MVLSNRYCFVRISSLFPKKLVQMKIHWIFRVVSLFNYQGCLFASLEATLLFYHNLFCLSSTFFKFFKLFCLKFFQTVVLLTLRYFIISFSVCQVFFWSFLTFFFHLASFRSQLVVVYSRFLTAFVFYHVLVCLSSTFFAFFQHRSTWFFFKLCHSTFSTASVFYHAVCRLSRSFLNYFIFLFFQNNSFIFFISNNFDSITPFRLFVNTFFNLFFILVTIQPLI